MLKKVLLPVIILFVTNSLAILAQVENSSTVLTGSLSTDSHLLSESYQTNNINVTQPAAAKKSPMLAGLMSLIVPGAGEVYNGEYLRAGIFVALEATLIIVGLHYDNKGDDQTDKFENYADGNWSVVKYAEWLNAHPKTADVQQISIDNTTPGLEPWERVNWSELNAAEKANSYSHSLPRHGEQQYYEMIGKYPQFSGGWNDFSSDDYHDISPNFTYYSGMRGQANDFYNVAAKAVIGIYLNHFLSALDAVWATIMNNKELSVNMRVKDLQFTDHTEYMPTFNLKYNF
jgi:hypothetical protein